MYYNVIDEYGELHELQVRTAKEAFEWYDYKYGENRAVNGHGAGQADITIVGFEFGDDGPITEWLIAKPLPDRQVKSPPYGGSPKTAFMVDE